MNRTKGISNTVVLDSVNNITRLAAELNQHNMDCDLPVGAMTAVYPVISMHIINMKSQNKAVRDDGIVGFRLCIRILNKMQNLYSAAEVTVGFLETIVSNTSPAGLGRDAEQCSQVDQQTQSDQMAILQALTAQHPQDITEGSKVPPMSWNLLNHDTNSRKQPQVPDLFSDVDLNMYNEFRTGGATAAQAQDMPYGLDLDFHATEIDTWMEGKPQGLEMDDSNMDAYAALSSQWLNPALPFNPS
ncbi:unnamed protein product [Fusarium langsethiae]|nr:unnamed protein product [Fusarium langsethiae]